VELSSLPLVRVQRTRLQARRPYHFFRSEWRDMVTVVTEGIFSYCGVKLKIDTDRYLAQSKMLFAHKESRSGT